MANTLNKIKTFVISSKLSPVDQKALLEFFSLLKDKELQIVLDLFESDPSWIKKLNDNYKNKKEAFRKGSKKMWREILDKELQELQAI